MYVLLPESSCVDKDLRVNPWIVLEAMAFPVPSTLDTILEELKLEPSQVQEVPGTIVAVVCIN